MIKPTTLRTTHYGIDYATVEANGVEYEVPIALGEAIMAAFKQIEYTLPTITAIAETNQGEYGRGKIEITRAVRKAIKEVTK